MIKPGLHQFCWLHGGYTGNKVDYMGCKVTWGLYWLYEGYMGYSGALRIPLDIKTTLTK